MSATLLFMGQYAGGVFVLVVGVLLITGGPRDPARRLWRRVHARVFRRGIEARVEQRFRTLKPLVDGLLDRWDAVTIFDARLERLHEGLQNQALFPRGIQQAPDMQLIRSELEFLRRAMAYDGGYKLALKVFGVGGPWSAVVDDPYEPNAGGHPDFDRALQDVRVNE